jgi:outer membrane receptor protein involved in Fe transport
MTEQKTPLAAAVFATLYPASQGIAQQAAPLPTRLEPVTVTATRRSENLQDVAQSVTALSTEFLQKHALTNLNDVVGAIPSANVISSTPGRNSIVIRGISTGSAEYRIDSPVSVYLDEQPMTAISQQVDVRLVDIERVETLPGPQGTLFGSSSQAGTIRYVTNKPDISGFSGEFATELGTTQHGEESYDVNGWVNIPVSDNIALRAVGYWSEEGGYVDNVLGPTLFGDSDNADRVEKDQNDYRTVGGRIAGLWTINEKWDLGLSYIYQRGDASGAWESDPALGDYKITRFFDEYRDDAWWQGSTTLTGDLGFAEFTLTGSFFDRDIAYEWDNTNYAQWRTLTYSPSNPDYITYYPYLFLYDTGYNKETTFNWQKQNRWSYEARLTSQGDSRLQWMAGAFYEDVYDWWQYGAKDNNLLATNAWLAGNSISCDLIDDPNVAPCPVPPTNYYYWNKYHNEVKQTAFFGELSYDLTDELSVTGGARWFEYKRNVFDQFQVPFGVPAYGDPDANGLTSKSTDSDTTFKFAAEYHVTPDVMLYALYSEGFRLGGRNSARAAASGQVRQTYGPDTLQNYEAGFKSEWLDHRLQLNASVFYMEWDEIQLHYDTDAWWNEGTINGGKAEQKGIELNGQWFATERLSFDWNIFLASPEFTEDVIIPNTDPPFVYLQEGMTLPVSPKEKYWAAVEYTFPNFAAVNGEFWTRFNYTYQGKTWDSLTAVRTHDLESLIPEWKSGTFQVGFTSANNWDAALVVRNVFDDRSYNYLSNTTYGDDFVGENPANPRWHHVRSLQRPLNVSLWFSKRW